MYKRNYPLMAEAGEADGGGSAVDRGDELPEELQDAVDEAKETLDSKSAEELAVEELAAAAVEEKPRAQDGKFVKKEKDASDNRIPKERFDEAVNKERAAREAAEARAAAAEARLRKEEQTADTQKFDEHIESLESAYAKHILDGESDKAASVMKQIRTAERQLAKMDSEAGMAQATSAAVEQVRWDVAVASLEASYPVLNPESAEYDQDMTDIVIAEQHRLMQTSGMAASKALTTAASKIISKFMKAHAADDEGEIGLAAAAKGGLDRKAAQVKKNLSTANAQPGALKSVGKDGDKGGERELSAKNITRAELDAMPESTKAKMRGDFI